MVGQNGVSNYEIFLGKNVFSILGVITHGRNFASGRIPVSMWSIRNMGLMLANLSFTPELIIQNVLKENA